MSDSAALKEIRPATSVGAPCVIAPARPPVLTVRQLSVRYPNIDRDALDGISLSINAGERIALLGPSGGGKTTLLRALEGSLPLRSGSVSADGNVVLIYQDLRLVVEKTALENVCMGASAELHAVGGIFSFPREIRERAHELLVDVGLGELADRRVSSLSGGQRQRVAIARALCARPGVLLADEPLGSLDPDNAARMLALLGQLQRKNGFALVVSMHHPGVGDDFFDRYLVVRESRLEADSSDSAKAWSHFAAAGGIVDGKKGDADTEGPTQDLAPNKRTTWSDRAWIALALFFVAFFFFSLTQIDTRGASSAGALANLFDFGRTILPESLEATAQLPWARLSASLLETLYMAFIGTALGLVFAFPLAVLAAKGISPNWLRVPVRFFLNVVRTVPSIFWALMFVVIVGLGPMAGVLALAAYSVGYLTKFFYEALEDIDNRPASALRSLGAGRGLTFFHAIFPAARPALAGSCLFMLEYNVRSASILGIVGAGGIGQDLMFYLEWRNFPAALAGLVLILGVVLILDFISRRWRARLTQARGL